MQKKMDRLKTLKDHIQKGILTDENAFLEIFKAVTTCPLGSNQLTGEVLGRVDSWEDFVAFHLELIEAILHIHQKEQSLYNQALSERTLSGRVFLSQAEEGLSGGRIYPLKKKDCSVDLVGDLHSDPESLLKIMSQTEFLKDRLMGRLHRLVFLGDYVDRGRSHLGMTTALMALKYLFEDDVFLLRGNHDGGVLLEDGSVKLPYRKPEADEDTDYFPLYLQRLGEQIQATRPLLRAYLTLWDSLSQMAFIERGEKVILAVHGGIPRPIEGGGRAFDYLKNLATMTSETLMDPTGRTMAQNMMWSDPYRGSGDLREGLGRFYYTKEQAEDFLETVEADGLVRGHEAFEEGVKVHFDGLVHTVFSSGGSDNPLTAYGFVRPKFLRLEASGDRTICQVL